MWILISGPYSAATEEERKKNLDKINEAALAVFRKGHIPVVGLNAALPLFGEDSSEQECYEDIMKMSLAVAKRCDAVLRIAHSPGADREVDLVASLGKPVFENLEQIVAVS
jgi:hypothetical protein